MINAHADLRAGLDMLVKFSGPDRHGTPAAPEPRH